MKSIAPLRGERIGVWQRVSVETPQPPVCQHPPTDRMGRNNVGVGCSVKAG